MLNILVAAALLYVAFHVIKGFGRLTPAAAAQLRSRGVMWLVPLLLLALALHGSAIAAALLIFAGLGVGVRRFFPQLAFYFLQKYLNRRFASWGDAEQGQGQARSYVGGGASMSAEEAHEVLGLRPEAYAADIIQAHRELMKKFHPDRGGSDRMASRVNQAKDILLHRHRRNSL